MKNDYEKLTSPLTFRDLSEVNLQRAVKWHGGSLAQWSILEWAGAAAGEMGEAANVAKKLHRLDLNITQNAVIARHPEAAKRREELVKQLASEIAGTVIYLDLFAQREGINLAVAVREEFNRISEREDFPERI